MKKIGILGSGIVAKQLGAGFINLGYEVVFGTTKPQNFDEFQQKKLAYRTGSFEEAASFGEILVLAVKGKYASEILKKIPANILNGKTVIDTTNPIEDAPPVNNVITFFSKEKSLIETLQEQFVNIHFVKAFNSIGASLMYQPNFTERPTMFICGDNDSSKKNVTEIVEKFGFDVEDLGKKESGKVIESLCILWCIEGFKTNIWDKHALRLMRKK